jgi:DNA-binding MarR family transcriptional regulator
VALLDRLEKVGLLDRQRSTRDRRRQGIFLTVRGASELAALISQVRTLERQLASHFTRSEFEQFVAFLQRLYC